MQGYAGPPPIAAREPADVSTPTANPAAAWPTPAETGAQTFTNPPAAAAPVSRYKNGNGGVSPFYKNGNGNGGHHPGNGNGGRKGPS